MPTIAPTASNCYELIPPPLQDDDRLNLKVRTGSASTLYNSFIFVYGGLTIGLELSEFSIGELLSAFHSRLFDAESKRFDNHLSGELFYLSLLDKQWVRVDIPKGQPKPRARMFHEITALNNCIYVFGGLSLKEGVNGEIEGTLDHWKFEVLNDLWEFNLETKRWSLLHDGSNFETDSSVPIPRYNHKVTEISSLTFVNRKHHFGIFIAGGKDVNNCQIYDNSIYDLVERRYIGSNKFRLRIDSSKNTELNMDKLIADKDNSINIDYKHNIIISFQESDDTRDEEASKGKPSQREEAIIVYTPMRTNVDNINSNPLFSFKLGRFINPGKILPLHKKESSYDPSVGKESSNISIPYNLRYPTGGLFGQNLVIIGFLPNEYDISIFIYNKPTGKWSRLNIFCNHDYGSHRFWGGYVWKSHHKVVLIGNYNTSKTTSSLRYFTSMLTINLPIANILASFELAGLPYSAAQKNRKSDSDEDANGEIKSNYSGFKSSEDDAQTQTGHTSDQDVSPRRVNSNDSNEKDPSSISFNEYVHYAAPKANFTTIRSVFPPTAVTLGRNAFDRYADTISDFELVSASGDRIPVSFTVLRERWGRYFIELFSRAYVEALYDFEKSSSPDQQLRARDRLEASRESLAMVNRLKYKDSISTGESISSTTSDSSFHSNANARKQDYAQQMLQYPSKLAPPETPRFRHPFQDHDKSSEKEISGLKSSMGDNKNRRFDSMGGSPKTESNTKDKSGNANSAFIDSAQQSPMSRKDSESSNSSFISAGQLQRLPPQQPLPEEPIPPIHIASNTHRGAPRKGSNDVNSPRTSLIHTLTLLRNIPKSPRESPFASPRASVSAQGNNESNENRQQDLLSKSREGSISKAQESNLAESLANTSDPSDIRPSFAKYGYNSPSVSSDSVTDKKPSPAFTSDAPPGSRDTKDTKLDDSTEYEEMKSSFLKFDNVDISEFKLIPFLTPRILYFPLSTVSIKGFCEYLYTGQVSNKWLLAPTTVDNLAIGKFFNVPLLYDLVSEVMFSIIGRKESYIIYEGKNLKMKYKHLLKLTNTKENFNIKYPLDEYEGLIDTIDDGYLDVILLHKGSSAHKAKVASNLHSRLSKYSTSSLKTDVDEIDELKNDESQSDVSAASSIARSSHNRGSVSTMLSDDSQYVDSSEDVQQDEPKNKDTTSSSDSEYELGYLDVFSSLSSSLDPKVKSIFDRAGNYLEALMNSEKGQVKESEKSEKKRAYTLTLEEIVPPTAEIPTDSVIDLIYEAGVIVSDIKILLRASNLKEMSKLLKKTKAELEPEIAKLEKKLHNPRRSSKIEASPASSAPSSRSAPSAPAAPATPAASTVPAAPAKQKPETGKETRDASDVKLKSVPSSVSLSTVGSQGLPRDSTLEKTRSNSSFIGMSALKSLKNKPDMSRNRRHLPEANKELDRQITSSIKRDEKLKHKKSKDSTRDTRPETHASRVPSVMSRTNSNFSETSLSSSKSKHKSLFHPLGKHRHEPTGNLTNGRQSGAAPSVHSDTSKSSSSSKTKHSIFGFRKH
ncbi:Piso0_001987 [Millerozyma farinosa CBS 7064]|uniref:Piso0_001987 protein n=1 Tax=Pichia sorbitophila (strain ATCC MYA-4447 / BCRC 22081 / CBS 7064 / NBRC 10061 / NRRL Y-12695) TaxID=559304 RepID=G8YM84_PICSO|nr:Piso0_001987 [Millerozyma farinosa CBS 7064]